MARALVEGSFQMMRDVARDQRGTHALRVERRQLLVCSADLRTLGVVEHRTVEGSRDMIDRELARRAHIDQLVKFGDLCYGCDLLETHHVRV